jgi:hypothetical protein
MPKQSARSSWPRSRPCERRPRNCAPRSRAPDGALRPGPCLDNWAKGWATGIACARSEGK